MTNTTQKFNIQFADLTFEKQEEIVAELTTRLQAEAEVQGKEFLTREWHDPKPTTWQEAFCRIYTIEYQLWQNEVEVDKKVITPGFMWETYQEAHVEEMARKKAEELFNLLKVKVTV